MTQFKLSARSNQRMEGVHPDLCRVAQRAIELTSIDFGVTEGLRSEARQRTLVSAGASKTMDSRHITGHALDVAAYLGREVRWDFGLYLQIAEAFRAAARELNIPIVWGACWATINRVEDLSEAVASYTERKRREGKRALIDGPHFELWREVYQ
ncbi:hypothetical protein D3C72_1708250 [compost metagenome]